MLSGLNKAQALDISPQKEFSDRQRGKKWIYLERNTLHRQSLGHLLMVRGRGVCGCEVFTGVGNFRGKKVGGIFQPVWGKGGDF